MGSTPLRSHKLLTTSHTRHPRLGHVQQHVRTRQQKPCAQPNDSRLSSMAALPQRTARCSSVSPSACVAALIAPTAVAVLPQGPAASGNRKAASAGAAWSYGQGSVALHVQHIAVLWRPLPAHPAYVPVNLYIPPHAARRAVGQR